MQPSAHNEPVKIGDWLADPRDDSLTRGSEKVKIEPRTMRLLMRLARTPGAVVSQDELLESVWTGVVVGTASIYQSMSQLRKVLGDNEDPPRYIETVARKGYRLVAAVTMPQPASSPPAINTTAPAGGAPPLGVERRTPPPKARKSYGRWVALAGAAVLAMLVAVWRFPPALTTASEPDPSSIAVLPFLDLTTGGSEQAFCDGLTEETSSWLAQVPTLRVVARTSAFSYRNRNADVRVIGRELATSHILEGSLRRSGDRLRVTVQLIDTHTGFHIWSNSYDVEAGDDISVQERIARAVVGNLELRMTADTESAFTGRRSRSTVAQRLYLIARSHAAKLDSQSNEQAITLYREALEADSSFALARLGLASAIGQRRSLESVPIEKLAPEIEPLLAEVARTAPQLVELYVVRGNFQLQMRRRDAALRDLHHALDMNTNSEDAADALGYYYLTAAQPRDALTYITIASGLDPRNYVKHLYRCMALADLAQFEQAQAACDNARSLAPHSAWAYAASSQMEAARGRIEEALKWNAMALERGADVAAINADRASWLAQLELMTEAGRVYDRAVAASGAAALRNRSLTAVGAMVAIVAGGRKQLDSFLQANGLAQSDDPRMLLELANARLLVDEARDARELVDRALASPALAPEDLSSPFSARVGYSYLLTVAAALRATGDEAGATRRLDELGGVLDELDKAGVQTYGLFLLRAQLAAMRGQGDAAMRALQRAASLGWSEPWLAERQVFFESLRARADFRELLAAARARNAATAAKLVPLRSVRLLGRPVGRAAWAVGIAGGHEDVHRAGDLVVPEGVLIPGLGKLQARILGPVVVGDELCQQLGG
jgi:TolB-like protein/DNA-binding winged helix-turn-helix (wHTH) protein/tetratricopeptide (TPR) repeat protein